jgi:beta-glucosidase
MTPKQAHLRALLEEMSLEEKAGQLNLLTGTMDSTGMKDSGDLEAKIRAGQCGAVFNVYTAAATRALQEAAMASRLRIPLLFGYDVIHGHRCIFPIPLALSCSWNLGLIEECARSAAAEAAADGLHWVFSPMLDISLDPRWGRVAEGSGEDPWLGSKIAAAMVRGYQGDDLSAADAVVSCVKHFALYGAVTAGRDYHMVDMSRRMMEETYLPPYRAAIAAGARTVMVAFNEINGVPATANRWLLTDLLRGEWGFDGWVVTDYTGISELIPHGIAADPASAAAQALSAGVDMDMVSEAYIAEIPALVASGRIAEATIDAAVLRVLETKWDLGLFQAPFARCDPARAQALHGSVESRQLARRAARESVVLLKNDGALLPLHPEGKLAVIGPLADGQRDMLGCWIAAGNPDDTVSALSGILAACHPLAQVSHAKGCEIQSEDASLLAAAIHLASQADVVILVLGESWQMSGEAASRSDIRLPKCQRKLARAIRKTGKPCLLVTLSGRPLELSWEARKFPAILHAWALGSEGGNALADVIFGKFPPVGKLTMSFPRALGQVPLTYREKPSGRPFAEATQYSSKYLDVPNTPLFPFGHGLTYGACQCGPVSVDPPVLQPGGCVTVSAEISNPCQHPVTETLQLYLRDPLASVTRPLKELRAYQRITLAAGESRVVDFQLTDADLTLLDAELKPRVEPGEFIVMLGTSSAEHQAASFTRVDGV